AGLPLAASASDDFPQRPLTLVVPWPAGGNTDAVSRALAQQLGAQLGKPVVVENRAGANGQIGATAVARAAPDGHTLLVASAETHSITSAAKRMPYDPQKDFQPIGSFAINPFMVVARSTLAVRDMKSLVAYAKANPGKLNYGSWGAGSTGQIAMEMLKLQAGIDMVHVPFNGTAPAETALLGGQIDLLVMPVGRAAAVNPTGKITVLGAMTAARTPLMPDVPTLREAGYENVVAANWFGIVAPARTPDPVVAKLSSALDAALANPELQGAFRARGVDLTQHSTSAFLRFIADEHARWSGTVANARIELN
ncbi:MAG TPA: tripartite tricarboxylate transporter substrate binding protein, partial [Ramlibacter sp.]|nr:tripartite tricarboxylate transporter substrate binding protein [Ramlibacter sp.]